MENINFDDYKGVFFENGEVVFKGKKDDESVPEEKRKTHGDIIEQYIDMKMESDEFKNNPYLIRLKNCNANIAMAAQVLFFTNAVVVLNTGAGSYLLFREDIDPKDLDVIKYYKDDIESLGTCQIAKIALFDDPAGAMIFDVPIENDDYTLPLDIRLDNYFAQRKGKGRK